MKLKIDENLPGECAEILGDGGFEADTVADERLAGAEDSAIAVKSRAEGRIPVTLDLDFANIREYQPAEYAGIIVLRPKRQDKHAVLGLVHRLALVLTNRGPAGELWIVDRIVYDSGLDRGSVAGCGGSGVSREECIAGLSPSGA